MQGHANFNFLFRQLLGRELASRYKTTALGVTWLMLQPLLMLGVYTLVFSGIFKTRWVDAATTADFALVLFAGLIIFNFFSEVLVSAPTLIVGQPNYVKKVVFPVGILPVVRVAAALVTALVSLVILLVAQAVVGQMPSPSAVLAPLILLEMVPMLLGIAWAVSALGVYLRDIAQFVGIVSSMLLFLSPIFFPSTSIPQGMRALIDLNPLVTPMEQLRAVTVQHSLPDFAALGQHFALSVLLAVLSFQLFRRLSRGFADVL
jgi:lipopolysaccharide transport system permease protein